MASSPPPTYSSTGYFSFLFCGFISVDAWTELIRSIIQKKSKVPKEDRSFGSVGDRFRVSIVGAIWDDIG